MDNLFNKAKGESVVAFMRGGVPEPYRIRLLGLMCCLSCKRTAVAGSMDLIKATTDTLAEIFRSTQVMYAQLADEKATSSQKAIISSGIEGVIRDAAALNSKFQMLVPKAKADMELLAVIAGQIDQTLKLYSSQSQGPLAQ